MVFKGMNFGKPLVRIALELQWIGGDGLFFFKLIGKCCGGAIVGAADIGKFDVTIFLELTGPECRADHRDAS